VGVSRQRLEHIDSLRGIAAFAVLLQHVFEILWEARPSNAFMAAGLDALLMDGINLGRFGVILFFLISGFVIPFSFKGQSPLFNFTVSRVFRLYPAYWVSIIAAVLVGIIVAAPPIPVEQIIANVTLLQRLMGQPDIRIAYWTLFFELIFYAGCAILFWRGYLGRWQILAGCAAGLILLAVVPALIRYGLDVAMPSPEDPIFLAYMFTGAVLRVGVLDGNAAARRVGYLLLLGLALAGVVLSGFLFRVTVNGNIFFAPWPLLNAYLAAIGLFVLSIHRSWPAGREIRSLGLISYSLYLNQGTVIVLMRAFAPPGPDLFSELLFAVVVIALAIVSSIATYRWIEQPFIQLGRSITHRAVPRQAAEVAP
jgi:peptidoglycan/LPS O-acetylase OafA/YrhL